MFFPITFSILSFLSITYMSTFFKGYTPFIRKKTPKCDSKNHHIMYSRIPRWKILISRWSKTNKEISRVKFKLAFLSCMRICMSLKKVWFCSNLMSILMCIIIYNILIAPTIENILNILKFNIKKWRKFYINGHLDF